MKFIVLYLVYFSVIFFPPISRHTGEYRLDSFLIILWPLLTLLCLSEREKVLRSRLLLTLPFLSLGASVCTSLLLQSVFLHTPFDLVLVNGYGYLRPLILSLFIITISSAKHQFKLSNLVLTGTIFHGLCAIVSIFSFPYLSELLTNAYRPVSMADWGAQRALGAFNTEHGLAFFGICTNLYIFYLLRSPPSYSQKNGIMLISSYIMSFLCIILSISKAAYLAIAAAYLFALFSSTSSPKHLYLLNPSRSVFKALSVFISIIVLCGLFIMILPQSTFDAFQYHFTEIQTLFSYFIGDSTAPPKFFSARVGWGWANALEAFNTNPITGDASISLRIFAGDGGYTESLGMHGLIGFLGLTTFLLLLFFSRTWICKLSKQSLSCQASLFHRQLSLSLIILLFGTGILRPRVGEILPLIILLPVLLENNPYYKQYKPV